MTTSYERLREECNKRLPDRLELNFGCEVQLAWLSSSHMQQELYKKFRTTKFVYDGQTHLLCERGWLDFNDMYTVQDKGFWKILGTPLTIIDVLRVLPTKFEGVTQFAIDTDGRLLWGPNNAIMTIFTLSLPLSAPENEAACEDVLSLITETV